MIRLGNYETSREIQMAKKQTERDAKISYIKQLVEKCEPFQDDVKDMYDTYHYINKQDKAFGDVLWHYLINYKDGHYLDGKRIDIDSYFGISVHSYLAHTPRISPKPEIGIHIWQKHNTIPLLSYIEDSENEKELPDLVSSLENLLKYFPHYRDKFFQIVSDRHWDGTL